MAHLADVFPTALTVLALEMVTRPILLVARLQEGRGLLRRQLPGAASGSECNSEKSAGQPPILRIKHGATSRLAGARFVPRRRTYGIGSALGLLVTSGRKT